VWQQTLGGVSCCSSSRLARARRDCHAGVFCRQPVFVDVRFFSGGHEAPNG